MSVIPKDRSAAYRPWQWKTLDGGANRQGQQQQDAERIKLINQQAYREGYDAGYAKGAARAAEEAQRLAALLAVAQQQLAGIEQNISEELVKLGLALARGLVRETLKVRPELVAAIVRESMREFPPFAQGARLRLHPDDAALVSAQLGTEFGEQWSVVEDATITRGGCRLETTTCEIDATIEARWQKLSAALAQDSSWIE